MLGCSGLDRKKHTKVGTGDSFECFKSALNVYH